MDASWGDEFTQIMPSPDSTVTRVQPFPALRDATQPLPAVAPTSAHDLPLWRPGTPSRPVPYSRRAEYGFREALRGISGEMETSGLQEQFQAALARTLGRKLYRHEATPHELVEIIEALV